MENDKSEEEPRMSGNNQETDESDEASERETERKSLVKNEANAVRRAIKSLNWRHELQSRNILRQISSDRNDERSNTELMREITAYQARFQRLDENYSRLYQKG